MRGQRSRKPIGFRLWVVHYRYHNLYGARLKAKEHGYEGAMYPWECAWVDDGEVTPLYMGADIVTGEITKIWTGLIEHHITADIAYAIDHYYKVTNDIDYMETYGYEIIFEAALFWASRLEYIEDRDRYEIRDVIEKDNKVSIKKLQGNSVEIYIKGEKQLIK